MKFWFQRVNVPVLGNSTGKSRTDSQSFGEKTNAFSRGLMQVIVLFCALEMLDALFTFAAVNLGLVLEGNHLVVQMAGNWVFLLLKFAGAVLSGLVLQKLHAHFPRLALGAAIGIAVFYGLVLAWNSGMIIRVLLKG